MGCHCKSSSYYRRPSFYFYHSFSNALCLSCNETPTHVWFIFLYGSFLLYTPSVHTGRSTQPVNISQHEATVQGTMLIVLLGSQYPEKVGSLWTRLLGVFLPAGYPHSVTDDYIKYTSKPLHAMKGRLMLP